MRGGGGVQNEIVWIIGGGGGQVHIHVGSGGMLPREILILDLSLDAIWWNLGLFSHKHLKLYIIDLHVK